MNPLLHQTRRHFFSRCGVGVGSMALGSLMARDAALAPKKTHFPAKAKNVIFLFMAGGPSQLETFEYKPLLTKLNGKPIPESYTKGKRFAFMDSSHRSDLLGPKIGFKQHGQSGAWVSDYLPHTAKIVDDISLVTTCKTDLFNHAPAKMFMNTGSGLFGRPSMGAWVTYGLGSECDDLPGFVVLQSGPRGPRGGSVLWGSGVLPTTYQGVPLRNKGDPIVNLSTPNEISAAQQRQVVDAVRELNLKRLVETGDQEINTRINAYEMAFKMQTSAPELMDTSDESQATLDLYGIKDPKETSFARNCLLARALCSSTTRIGTTTAAPRRIWRSTCRSNARISTKPAPRSSKISSNAACSMTRSSSGVVNSAARRWARCVNPPDAITTSTPSPCGSPVAASKAASPTE
jgi:hypothetical protein